MKKRGMATNFTALDEYLIEFMSPTLKAHFNSRSRPLKTSAKSPVALRRTPHDEIRVSPRVSALRAQGMGRAQAAAKAEDVANYVPRSTSWDGLPLTRRMRRQGHVSDARGAAADMIRQWRKNGKQFSALDQYLVELSEKTEEQRRESRPKDWAKTGAKWGAGVGAGLGAVQGAALNAGFGVGGPQALANIAGAGVGGAIGTGLQGAGIGYIAGRISRSNERKRAMAALRNKQQPAK